VAELAAPEGGESLTVWHAAPDKEVLVAVVLDDGRVVDFTPPPYARNGRAGR
jgi:hypothetical protein